MPAVSKSQQIAAALALAAKRGKFPVDKLKGSALSMYNSMTVEELEHYAKTKRKGLPKRLRRKKK